MRDVTISAVLNGWIARVGCQTLVYTDKKQLLKDLGEYMANPSAKQKKFVETAVNKRMMECPVAGAPCPPPQMPMTNETSMGIAGQVTSRGR